MQKVVKYQDLKNDMTDTCNFQPVDIGVTGVLKTNVQKYLKSFACNRGCEEKCILIEKSTGLRTSYLRSVDLVVSYNIYSTQKKVQQNDMLQCEHCDFLTTHPGNLKILSCKHTDDMFQCQHYDYSAANPRNLNENSHVHNVVTAAYYQYVHTGDMLQRQYCEFKTAHSRHS